MTPIYSGIWHPDMPIEYRDEIVTGDARVLAERIPDASAALAFVDPPYWVGFDYGHSKDTDIDYLEPDWIVSEARRIATVACITPGIANIWNYPRADWVLGWFKFGGTGRNTWGGFNVWEPVLVYGTPPGRFWQDAVNVPTYRNHLNINGVYAEGEKYICPKPEPLLAWLIEGMTSAGDVVIDLTCGLGTSPTVSKKLGRHWIGFEIDPATAERARERILLTQPPLFVTQPEQAELFTVTE